MKKTTVQENILIRVNDELIDVYSNQTILQSLLQANVSFPHHCSHDYLECTNGKYASCTVRLVNARGTRKVRACQTLVKAGMVISTI